MCGICGQLTTSRLSGSSTVRIGLGAQRHRGPDESGIWADGHCALGHRRLAIIDLSEAGRQPLCNEDGTVWITFNGEIYNFQALREELEGLGHGFRTRTDTEVIVHAYEQWGVECVRRLRGMFAFGIWDQRRRRLFLARDRVGKKPLFYCQHRDRFLFASELQGLLADPEAPRQVDLVAMDAYLALGYVPGPRTGFRGVWKLPPAHWLTLELTADGPVTRVERYWSLPYEPKLRLGEREACEALQEKLGEAVRLRMISDVPLGVFLSGGMDSSIVVGLMAQASSQPVKTFSIGFEEAAYNELDHARRVAERFGTEHQEFVVRPDALSVLPRLVRHYGEPFADESALPTFYLAQMTRASVTVALNGDGGDESFAGYARYAGNRLAEWIHRVPGGREGAALASRLLPDTADPKSRRQQARRFLSAAGRPMAQRYGAWLGYFSPEARAALYTPDLRACLGGEPVPDWWGPLFAGTQGLDPADVAMAVDVESYLPYDLLVKVDITTMAHSLEARSPFLDHELMEFAARLPVGLKLRGGTGKYLLRRAFADLVPAENLRRRKMGFGVPIARWFRGPLREMLCDTLLSTRSLARGYFQPREIKRLIDEHLQSGTDRAFHLWNLLMLELWHQEMIDAAPRPHQAPCVRVEA